MIVEANEGLDRSRAVVKRPAALKRQAFIVDRAKEALDLAIRLRTAWPKQVMDDAQTA